MFWICLAWYLVGVVITLLGFKVCNGYVTVGALTTALTGGGIAGPMMIGPVSMFILTDSEVSNRKLF